MWYRHRYDAREVASMSGSNLYFLVETPWAWFVSALNKLAVVLWSPGSDFSLLSLFAAFCVGALSLVWKRRSGNRPLKLKVLLRAVFPRWLIKSASSKADIGFFFFNSFFGIIIFGWAIVSYHLVSKYTNDGFAAVFGSMPPSSMPAVYATLILTVALFIAYELGYWLDHYLSHTIPFLWEFHKVHHTAEVLSPLTNYRVHPVDSVVFGNILALSMGATEGATNYLFGRVTDQFVISNSNIIAVAFTYLVSHLQHSHFWISFPGIWGYLLLSPAHHQIHHSVNPIHFNKNLGSCLAIWDWCFGTLYVPSREREKLVFGVEPKDSRAHTMSEALIAPVGHAFGHVVPSVRRPRVPVRATG
jgi:sterol desaturase/sphingolipid hydroxylase (fatty acid hydroxylase superfamily)